MEPISQKYTRNRIISCYFFAVKFGISRSGLARIFILFLERNTFRKFFKIMRKFRIKFFNFSTILIFVTISDRIERISQKYTRNRIISSYVLLHCGVQHLQVRVCTNFFFGKKTLLENFQKLCENFL
jgi:hypothetical protein